MHIDDSGFNETRKRVFSELGLSDMNSGAYSGEWAPTASRRTVEVKSPVNGSVLGKVALGADEDYERVVQAAVKAQREWATIPAPKRGEYIRRIADALIAYKETLGLLVSLEVGKTLSEGQGEVQEMIDIGNFATGLSRQIYGLTIASERPEHRLYEQWQPLGVVGVITAFNFPIAVWSWNSLIAAVCGDSVVWKPSTKAPLTAIAVTRIANRVLQENGAPQIFFLIVGAGASVGEAMNNDKRIPLVSFTGSVATGRKTAEAVARRLGRSLLELGGNNGCIVSDKCDAAVALKGVAFGSLATAGQRCTTTRRAIIHEAVYDEFSKKLTKMFRDAPVGNPLVQGTLIGPLVSEDAVKQYLKAIDRAKNEGGKVLYGGEKAVVKGCEGGYYVKPALVEARPGMEILREETFAPLLYLLKYETLDEALRLHNAVPQGLSSSIFTRDQREAELFLSARGSDCGLANVNTGTAGAEIGGAFGGEKETGGGRESGSDAWKAYARRQTVTINYGKDVPLSQGVRFDV